MKTAEITRNKTLAKVAKGVAPPTAAANLPASTFGLFMEIWRKDGIRGINKGVNAVALRQVSKVERQLPSLPLWLTGLVWRAPPPQATNWSSRIGIARAAEQTIKELGHKKPGEPLTPTEKVTASAIGASRSALLALVHRPRCQLTEGKPSLADGIARTHQVALSDAGTTRSK